MSDQPNILVMMTDQQRFDSLGCYGFEAGRTPNLDHLATEGVLFEHCYVTNSICTPSRASMLTGKHLPGHGVYKLYDNLPEGEVLFTKRLQSMGYQTALFGKLHVCSRVYEAVRRHPNDGFDIYEWCLEPSLYMEVPLNAYARWLDRTAPAFWKRLYRERRDLRVPREFHMTHWAAQRTIDFIQQREDDQPFFCMLSVFDPHDPYQDHSLEMRELLDADKIPDPVIVEGELEHGPSALRRLSTHVPFAGRHGERSLAEIREDRLGYHASIALIDLEFGRVLDALEEAEIADNTLVIFISDHGDLLGDHQQFTKGAALYDPCVRVPFLMRWPARFEGGQRFTQLVQPHDVAATVLAAAGMSAEDLHSHMPDAVDLSQLGAGEVDSTHDCAYCMFPNSGLSFEKGYASYFDPPIYSVMIRDERLKLILFYGDATDGPCEGLLFDMQDDPLETNSLWDHADYVGVRLEMTERLFDWLAEQEIRYLGSRGGESVPPFWMDRLQS